MNRFIGAAILCLGTFQLATAVESFHFDSNGPGANLPGSLLTMDTFDWGPGNALAVGRNTAVANYLAGAGPTTFELFYQAQLSSLRLGGGGQPLPNLGPGGYELT